MSSVAHQVEAGTWQAALALSFEESPHRTVMRRQHNGPLLVQRPFYPEGDVCHAVLLHPPAGVVGGDELRIDIDCHQNANALITTPGATRFYGSDNRTARQNIKLNVHGGSLEWLPMETIYFDECQADQHVQVSLDRQSSFIGWEISCFGRTAGDFPLVTGSARVSLDVELEGLPVLHERLSINGEADINRASGLRGKTVTGTLIAIAPDFDAGYCVTRLRDALPGDFFAVTQIDDLLAVRYFGGNSEQARHGFFNAWKILRPNTLKRPACMPRIWAT